MDVDEMQKKLAIWAERNPEERFTDIYNLLYDENWLRRAQSAVKSNVGSRTAGVDGLKMSDFEEDLEENLRDLRQDLKEETFAPKPVRRTYIPKSDGRKRPLGIPTIKDRIVQEALRMVLEPIYEADFSQSSYGFRPNRSTMDAIQMVHVLTRERLKYFWVIDADVEAFFDNVDHQTLEQIVQDRIKDKQIRDLIWEFLKAGIMEEGNYRHSMLGTPQGGIVSPLLANVYLNELDQWVKKWTDLSRNKKRKRRRQGKGNWKYVRYADDFLLLSNGHKAEVEEMEGKLREYLSKELSLTLSKKKTEITHVNDGLNFLGFHIERSVNRKGNRSTQITIPKKAKKDFRKKVQTALSGDHESSQRAKVMALNMLIRGWGQYYKHCSGAATEYHDLDYFIWWKLVEWIAEKRKITVSKAIRRIEKGESKSSTVGAKLTRLQDLNTSTRYYMGKALKRHPYLEESPIQREELPGEGHWLGGEGARAGLKDQRMRALARDSWTCQECRTGLTRKRAEVHHLNPVRKYSNPEEANRLENLESLCAECHKEKDPYR